MTLKLMGTLLGCGEMEDSIEVQLAINHLVLLTKMCTTKCEYGIYSNTLLLLEKEVNMRTL